MKLKIDWKALARASWKATRSVSPGGLHLTGTFLGVLGALGVLAGALVQRSGHGPHLPPARAIRSQPPPVHGPPARIAIFRRAGQDRLVPSA